MKIKRDITWVTCCHITATLQNPTKQKWNDTKSLIAEVDLVGNANTSYERD